MGYSFGRVMGIFCVGLLAAGCSATLHVAPAVLDDVRKVGSVLKEDSYSILWEGNEEISNVFVVDVGAVDSKDAFDKAVTFFRNHKWEIVAQDPPVWAQLRSTVWKGAYLTLDSFDSSTLRKYPESLRRATEGVRVNRKSLVLLDVRQDGDPKK
ncbi:hypothetical protein [Streptosporangium sandarakinum]|uniref:hypothetical protein n=1 Tax=Streptosporangium sandarakinum TaxID=1260955 RepID=UPI0036BEA679